MAVVITHNSDSIPNDVIMEVARRFLILHEEGNRLILDGDDIEDVKSFVGEDWTAELDLNV